MDTLIVNHRVRGFEGREPVFDEHEDTGSTAVRIDLPSAAAAQAFFPDSELCDATMRWRERVSKGLRTRPFVRRRRRPSAERVLVDRATRRYPPAAARQEEVCGGN